MSRFQRFKNAALTSYIALGFSVVFGLISVPLALHYLTKAEFGVWALATQLAGYLALLDLGMRFSVTRTLIDHKDEKSTGVYGSSIKASLLIGAAQGVLVLVIGLAALHWLTDWLRVPPALRVAFFWLMAAQIGMTAISFVSRIFPQALGAWQRLDWANFAQILQTALWTLGLWVGFHLGWGIYAIAISGASAWAVGVAVTGAATAKLRLWPGKNEWGSVSRRQMRELFSYTMDVFLINLGSQIILASQTILVTRLMDVAAIASWTILGKAFSLISQILFGTISMSMPAFAEMQARNESELLWRRYRSLFMVVSVGATIIMTVFAACNASFVALWVRERVAWSRLNDVLFAVWVLLLTHQCCINSLLLSLKRAKSLSYVYVLEGAAFIGLATVTIPRTGFTGMLVCSILCTFLFTFSFGAFQLSKQIREASGGSLMRWHWPALKMMLLMVPIWLLLEWSLRGASHIVHLATMGAILVPAAITMAFRFALPADVARELAEKLPGPTRRLVLRGEQKTA